jgi:hypothetical protein
MSDWFKLMSFDLGNEPSSVGQGDRVDMLTTWRWA